MLSKALSYCLQEETPVSFSDILNLQPTTTRVQRFTIQQQPARETQNQPRFRPSSPKLMANQSSSESYHNERPTLPVKKPSPYESDWTRVILNKYYNLNSSGARQEVRRRAMSIQMNTRNVKYRIRDLSSHLQSERT